LAIANVATADQIGALLTGYRGIAVSVHDWQWGVHGHDSGLQGTVTQSPIHVGRPGVNGSIVIFSVPDGDQS
jgi:hypothetical protein